MYSGSDSAAGVSSQTVIPGRPCASDHSRYPLAFCHKLWESSMSGSGVMRSRSPRRCVRMPNWCETSLKEDLKMSRMLLSRTMLTGLILGLLFATLSSSDAQSGVEPTGTAPFGTCIAECKEEDDALDKCIAKCEPLLYQQEPCPDVSLQGHETQQSNNDCCCQLVWPLGECTTKSICDEIGGQCVSSAVGCTSCRK